MKFLALVPLVLVASCASHPQPVVRPVSPAAVDPVETVRYQEVIRAYHVGRFIDPNHPETMHEQHPVYRIESTGRWNLHPGRASGVTTLNPPPDAAHAPLPVDDALVAEMNRQREITGRVLSEAVQLSRSVGELQRMFEEMKNLARNDAFLGARLTAAEQQIAGFEERLQQGPPPSSEQSDDGFQFAPEPIIAPDP